MLNKYMTAFVIIATTFAWSPASQAAQVCGCYLPGKKAHCNRIRLGDKCKPWCESWAAEKRAPVTSRMVDEGACGSFQ